MRKELGRFLWANQLVFVEQLEEHFEREKNHCRYFSGGSDSNKVFSQIILKNIPKSSVTVRG